ncbi:hypothetical protein G6011_06735 [Alternaria panax]|uniref:Heterokaryon incompatibility domain-containing protein n=1 Tax=Alternaria panax TaxID=48097 RepID=A0AAD4I8B2_9PLEO|nr:hypothetical protein G6011_06735 [Alternaria panax]
MVLCSVCSQLNITLSDTASQILGLYEEIRDRSYGSDADHGGCGGCEFFCRLLETSFSESKLLGKTVDFASTRLILNEYFYESDGKRTWMCKVDDHVLEICTEQESKDSVPEFDHKRPVPADPFDHSCFQMINSWMEECRNHAGCCTSAPVALPKRLIEIPSDPSKPLRLCITNDELDKYTILSHCWGSKGLLKLTNVLVAQFQNVIPRELLPKSFTDAIDITRRLGFRYIWIDALCIIQDNTEDWAQEAGKMSSYYGLATLMISADVAKDSSQGILNSRHVLYSPVMGKERKYCLRQRRLRWDTDITESILATRGWTAQERMLAPRILHYTEKQIIWECAEGLRHEASGVIKEKKKELEPGNIDVAFLKATIQPFVTGALQKTNSTASRRYNDELELIDTEVTKALLHQLQAWQQCVDQYSSRTLTIPTDKLYALAGVAAIVNHNGALGHYLSGSWSAYLATNLNWCRQSSEVLSSPPVYIAPSWSWASTNGAVIHPLVITPPQELLPPSEEIGKVWVSKFELKLIEQHMVFQDERYIYGAVLEGSYIVVEGACIVYEELFQLAESIYGGSPCIPKLRLDRSKLYDGPENFRGFGDSSPEEEPQSDLQTSPPPWDFCMFTVGDIWRNAKGSVDMILLQWVDEEMRVAERVGHGRMEAWMSFWMESEDPQRFDGLFQAAPWKRETVKLV